MPQIPSMRANPVYFLLPISIRQAGLTALILLINLPALYPAQAQDEAPQPSAAIMVNHEGYRAADEKVAMVSSALALPFIVQTEAEGVEIVRGLLQLRQPNDPNSGGNIWAADFSVLQATGTYRLQVPGLGVSFPFEVAETRYRPLLLQSLRAIHWLRAGQSVGEDFAGEWARDPILPTETQRYRPEAATPEIVDITAGWLEGSSLGQFVTSGAYSAGLLMSLQATFPNAVPDGGLGLESGANGTPDLLDLIRPQIDWLLHMQTEAGSFGHKRTPLEPVTSQASMPDALTVYLFDPATASTAGACAALAKASRLYAPRDATYAQTCREAALRAWEYLEANPEPIVFENPEAVQTKAYPDQDDSDERFWAAIELLLATDAAIFEDIAIAIAEKRLPLLSAAGYWGNVMPLAAAAVLTEATPEQVSATLREELQQDLLSLAETIHQRAEQDAFGLTLDPGGFTWGSNATLMQNAFVLLLADRTAGLPEYRQTAMDQLHYILGRNPLNRSFVTGFGHAPPRHPYLPKPLQVQEDQPFPGFLVGGANATLNDGVLKSRFGESSPPATVYADDAASFASNEVAIEWNAVTAWVVAALIEPPPQP